MITIVLSIALLLSLTVIALLWRGRENDRRDSAAKIEHLQREAAKAIEERQREIDNHRDTIQNLRIEASRLEERIKHLDDTIKANAERGDNDAARFKAIAADILNANSRLLNEQHESRLEAILKPLRDNIDNFRKAVNDSYSTEARERFSLQKSIEELVKTNASIGNEARALARALRSDSKVQGDWGELILESILEKSGLRKNEEFFVQVTTDADGNTLRDESGRHMRPDVVVKYPGGKSLVIDSKVSLTAYIDMVNADDDRQAKADALSRHLRSVKQHLNELSTKNYQALIGSDVTDFVMMFIPNEGAYIAAMQREPSLWQEAYDKRVLIVSPTHLVSALKLIAQLWDHDRQTRNAVNIATEAGRLYDKFAGVIKSMAEIEKGIESTRKAYDDVMKKIATGRGNLIGKVETLRKLGARATKQLPQADDDDSETE